MRVHHRLLRDCGVSVDAPEVALIRPERFPLGGTHIHAAAQADHCVTVELPAELVLEADPGRVAGQDEPPVTGHRRENLQGGR